MDIRQRIYVTIANTPPIVRRMGMIYLAGALCFNLLGSYVDAKEYLLNFRTGNMSHFPKNPTTIHNEWEAVKYGASVNMYPRLFDSMVFPFTAASYVVPSLVLYMNAPPPPSSDATGTDKDK